MEQIARQASVSKRTLYKYYPVKEALLARVLEDALDKDLKEYTLQPDPGAGFTAAVAPLLQASARWCERHPDYLLPYVRYRFATFDPRAASGDDPGLLPLWTKLIAVGQGRGEIRPDRPAEQLGFYFHYLYLGALMRWLTAPQLDLQHEFDTVLALFGRGAAP
ncbi:TetR/AcrR family transcriptional regulator [Castellaniella sp.]|uniref:TetR/AcrR family transcriptional regulator n=1 Tax=Castellaniella sp. TaxID=1955812 RepID=UPI003C74CCA4